jgi:Protein of unknown function (DUF3455)
MNKFAGNKRGGPRRAPACASVIALTMTLTTFAHAQELPAPIQAPGETPLLTVHAEGAQVYECKADAAGKLVWAFREPIATLLRDGKTIGRHYAGPKWELDPTNASHLPGDGGGVQGKVEGKAPGASASDIAWLKLSVAAHFGQGLLSDATTVQRINTHGGALEGVCEAAGAFRSVAYSADYVFLKK